MKKIMLLLTFVVSTNVSADLKTDLEQQITSLMQKVITFLLLEAGPIEIG